MAGPVMSFHDLIALEAAREIMSLPNNMPEGQTKALVQCIVLKAIERAKETVRHD